MTQQPMQFGNCAIHPLSTIVTQHPKTGSENVLSRSSVMCTCTDHSPVTHNPFTLISLSKVDSRTQLPDKLFAHWRCSGAAQMECQRLMETTTEHLALTALHAIIHTQLFGLQWGTSISWNFTASEPKQPQSDLTSN